MINWLYNHIDYITESIVCFILLSQLFVTFMLFFLTTKLLQVFCDLVKQLYVSYLFDIRNHKPDYQSNNWQE